ncbi:hypothetical protein FRC10_008101 [Ceratobasidium sp. 414]|nr:hypothetical protein FRC10_008101 [Ceratobasidium sp. 414]
MQKLHTKAPALIVWTFCMYNGSITTMADLEDTLDSFDFINPADIIQVTHLIPDFQSGTSSDLLNGPSIVLDDWEQGDWMFYYVNRYVLNIISNESETKSYKYGSVGHYQHHVKPAEHLNVELAGSYKYNDNNTLSEPEELERPDMDTEGTSEPPNVIAPTAEDEGAEDEEEDRGAEEEDEGVEEEYWGRLAI